MAIIVLCIAIVFFIRKFIESLFNLKVLLSKNNRNDVSKQRHGMVLNKKTGKLEADQSVILPF